MFVIIIMECNYLKQPKIGLILTLMDFYHCNILRSRIDWIRYCKTDIM